MNRLAKYSRYQSFIGTKYCVYNIEKCIKQLQRNMDIEYDIKFYINSNISSSIKCYEDINTFEHIKGNIEITIIGSLEDLNTIIKKIKNHI